ncbi:MAG: hypothetical protein ACN6OP_20940 [Pseudomonadales bacterium]
MKVIKKGAAHIDMPRRHTCLGCQSELEFTESDGRVITNHGFRVLVVACPECATEFKVELQRPPEVPKYTMDCKTSPLDADKHTLSNTTKGYVNRLGHIEA